jgi:hypothetical protein
MILVLDAGLLVEQARLLSRQYDGTTFSSKLKDQQHTSPTHYSQVASATASTASNFGLMYHALWDASLEWRSTLQQVETSYALAIAQIIEARDIALVNLRDRFEEKNKMLWAT